MVLVTASATLGFPAAFRAIIDNGFARGGRPEDIARFLDVPVAWFFAAVAVANEIIWRNFSTDVYVIWDTLGQMGVMFAFFIANFKLIEAHWQESEES